jgi:hypothetical protein
MKDGKLQFLDICIHTDGTMLWTTSAEKDTNLFLYPTPHSAHPSGVVKGIVRSLISKYYRQNSFREYFVSCCNKLFARLMERGHSKKRLYVIFRYAFSMLSKEENNDNNHTFTKRFFFHIRYDPNGTRRSWIRNALATNVLSAMTNNCPITIGYSRPRNINELLGSKRFVNSESGAL